MLRGHGRMSEDLRFCLLEFFSVIYNFILFSSLFVKIKVKVKVKVDYD